MSLPMRCDVMTPVLACGWLLSPMSHRTASFLYSDDLGGRPPFNLLQVKGFRWLTPPG
jgi:hypothetical protein